MVIAILDSGVALGHSAPAYRLRSNTAEVPLNGIDDDGNGYEDDVTDWDSGDLDADPTPSPSPTP